MYFQTPISSIQKATFFRNEKVLKNSNKLTIITGFSKDVVQSVSDKVAVETSGKLTKIKKVGTMYKVTCKSIRKVSL